VEKDVVYDAFRNIKRENIHTKSRNPEEGDKGFALFD
jgi:hypothetical protein